MGSGEVRLDSAELALPTGARVLFAALYYGGNLALLSNTLPFAGAFSFEPTSPTTTTWSR